MAATGHDETVTDGTEEGGGERESAPRARRGDRLGAVAGVVGELLITMGLILALFIAYSLWWTNVLADQQAGHEETQVRHAWAQDTKHGDGAPGALDTANGIGFLHVPAMGGNFEVLVKKGTSLSVLNQGVAGYYTSPVKSAMPWSASGNFVMAAHRDGHGAKFHNIDKIKDGDPIVFETRDTWYIYRVYDILPQTSKYNVRVLDPIPKESGRTKRGRYITLTTCTPVFTSEYRYIVWGELVRTQRVDARRTLPLELSRAG